MALSDKQRTELTAIYRDSLTRWARAVETLHRVQPQMFQATIKSIRLLRKLLRETPASQRNQRERFQQLLRYNLQAAHFWRRKKSLSECRDFYEMQVIGLTESLQDKAEKNETAENRALAAATEIAAQISLRSLGRIRERKS